MFQGTKWDTENNLLFIAVAGEIAFLSFDAVAHALAFNEDNRHIMANSSINISAINTRLNESTIHNFATFNFAQDFLTIFQVLLQTFCLLILTHEAKESAALKLSLRQKMLTIFLLSYISVCNIAIWVSCSFIETDYSQGKVSLYVVNELVIGERNWKFVSTLLYPLVLFYRFHSVKQVLIAGIRVHATDINETPGSDQQPITS